MELSRQIEDKSSGTKRRIIAKRIEGVLTSVQQYSSAVDSMTQTNQIAALLWGCLKIGVQVAHAMASVDLEMLEIDLFAGRSQSYRVFRKDLKAFC